MENHTVFISVGSNLGNKLFNCQNGIAALERTGASVVKDRSKFYKTEPVDYNNQDWFINGVVKIETTLDPFQLLDELKSIEQDAGRSNDTIRFGPRILDLDIVIYDDIVIKSSTLIVPHPKMHKRRFVLKPFCDIASNIVHPVFKKDIQNLLDNLGDNEKKVVLFRCDC